jgi:hypothetical protein
MPLNSSWGYRIDYDKEIANDLKEIAAAERHIPLAQVLTKQERDGAWFNLSVVAFLFANVEQRSPLLKLSATDVADLWWYCELDASWSEYDVPEPSSGWYSRGEAINKRLVAEFGEYVHGDPQKLIKKYRAALSRHRRNKVRHG